MSTEQTSSPVFDTIPFPVAPQDAAAVLRWYVDAGVDIAIGEEPIDRTVEPPPPPVPQQAPQHTQQPQPTQRATQQRPPRAQPPALQARQGPSATELAAKAKTLEELKSIMNDFEGCPLKRMATQMVFGNGPADAKLMVIGEAPGADEDRSGVPFVGRAGHLLDKMLASIDAPRDSVYVTNVIPWRPPGNRTPTPEEIATCLPFIMRCIELVKPQAILLLGGSSASAILDTKDGITRIRGKWKSLERPESNESPALSIPAMATFHPAYLLRFPAKKSFAWNDLLTIKARLDEN